MDQPGQSPRFELVQRLTARETKDYTLEIDEFRRGDDQFCMVHFTVRRWAPAVFKQMKQEWTLFRKCVRCPLFAAVPNNFETEKWRKFITWFGFKPSMRIITESGETRSMYVNYD